jgi:hypothetical protein
MYFNKKGKIDTHTDPFPGSDLALFIDVYVPIQESDQCVHRSCPFYWSTCTKPGKWSVCVSILPFLLKYMHQARKGISVCILSWLGTCTSKQRVRSMHTLITFLAWYIYFNKKDKIDTHTQESDQCVYRSCPFHWSTCTKPGKWSVCVSILPLFIEVHVPNQESDQCVHRS